MSVNGYDRCVGKRSGGISAIALADVRAMADIEYDRETDAVLEIIIDSEYPFSYYDFKEGEASYVERVVVRDGVASVVHKLTFSIERMDAQTGRAVSEIAKASKHGLLAVVTTTNGVSLLVGYSDRFECERPLKLAAATGMTGSMAGDDTLETITLQSEDDAKAKTFTGTLEQ